MLRDTYTLALDQRRGLLPGTGLLKKVTMYCYSPGDSYLDATDQAGNLLGDAVYLDGLKLAEADTVQPAAAPALYTFGDQLALEQLSFVPQAFPLGDEITIDSQWRAATAGARLHRLRAPGRCTGRDRGGV